MRRDLPTLSTLTIRDITAKPRLITHCILVSNKSCAIIPTEQTRLLNKSIVAGTVAFNLQLVPRLHPISAVVYLGIVAFVFLKHSSPLCRVRSFGLGFVVFIALLRNHTLYIPTIIIILHWRYEHPLERLFKTRYIVFVQDITSTGS